MQERQSQKGLYSLPSLQPFQLLTGGTDFARFTLSSLFTLLHSVGADLNSRRLRANVTVR
jgi:hypothetical protein